MLLDSNSLIYRAYFALINTPLTTSKGQLVNAVFGFWSIVLRGFQDVQPDYVIAAFDLAGPTFRHEQYAEYKATRREMPDDLRDQFPIVREILEAFGIPIYQLQGFEADDLIATLVRQAEEREVETTIVSGDLDLLQIVSDKTTLMTHARRRPADRLLRPGHRSWSATACSPEQMIDFKALKGDTTDNIPGIAGVGEKTAAKLVMTTARSTASTPTSTRCSQRSCASSSRRHRDDVLRWRDLVTVRAGSADRARPRARSPRRLRPRGGPAAVPRVRVPFARRAAAGHDRRGDHARRASCCARPTVSAPIPACSCRRTAVGRRASRGRRRRRRRHAAEPRLRCAAGDRCRSPSPGNGQARFGRFDVRRRARRARSDDFAPASTSRARAIGWSH